MMKRALRRLVLPMIVSCVAAGCQSKPSSSSAQGADATPAGEQVKPPQGPPAADSPAADPPAADKPAHAEPAADKPAQDTPEAASLFDSGPVLERVFDPKDLPEAIKPQGTLKWGIAFTDFTRDNYVIATVSQTPGKAAQGQPTKTGLIKVEHWILDGDFETTWKRHGEFKELVSDCPDDLVLQVKRGDWSLTHLSGGSYAEVTFAWSAGCRSDVSPVTHKVLLIHDGKKHVLRGTTREWPSRTDAVGGEFTAGGEFKGAPPAYLKHATMVWEKTRDL